MKKFVSELKIYDPEVAPQAEFTVDSGVSTLNLTSASHGLKDGNVVVLTVTSEAGDALPTGLEELTRYYVVNETADTFQLSETLGGAPVAFSDDGQGTFTYNLKGKVLYVADFEDIVLTMHTKDNANLTFKVLGSASEEMPNFFVAKASDNMYDTIQLKDLEDNIGVDGDDGVAVAGTDDVRQFELNTNGINYLTAEITAYTAGNLGLSATLYERE